MTRPHPIALLALTAAALVAAAAWWLTDNPLAADAHTARSPDPPAELHGPPAADPETDAPPSLADEPLPPLDHDHDEGFSGHDLWDHINDPANSDLPPDLFAELTQLAIDIVRADATGHGRDRWPHHWTNDTHDARAEPCCTDIAIHAAGAYTHPTAPDVIEVTVIWTGNHPDQPSLVEQTSHVRLQRNAPGWGPA